MCKAIDEMRQESEEKGSVETKLADIKELMKNLQITSQEAMRLLSVPGDMQKMLSEKL